MQRIEESEELPPRLIAARYILQLSADSSMALIEPTA
jgi:hypothetical protein